MVRPLSSSRSIVMKVLATAAASSVVALVIVACSGASPTELFNDVNPSKPTSGGGRDAASREPELDDPGPGPGPGPGSGTDPRDAGDAGPTADAGPTTGDGGQDASFDGSPDGSVKPPIAGYIPCGGANKVCNAKTEACCIKQGAPPDLECKAFNGGGNACSGGSLSVKCNDRSDCPLGQVCCGLLDDNEGYLSVQCRLTCIGGNNLTAVRFCDPRALTDECLNIGQQCVLSQRLPGFGVCK
jgi:hypothetical protein